jgi:hypothetical protein
MGCLQADAPSLQDALIVTQRSADRAAKMLSELDALIQNKFLRSTELTAKGKPKISPWAWIQHRGQLERLQWSLRDVRQSISLTFTALNSASV